MQKKHLRIVGLVFWIVAAGVAIAAVGSSHGTESDHSLLRYFLGPNVTITAIDPSNRLRVDDPVFYLQVDGSWTQIGFVTDRSSEQKQVQIAWNSADIHDDHCELILYQNDGGLDAVIATMLPQQKRDQIQRRLVAAMSQHGDELSAAFIPLVETTLMESLPVLETEIRRSIDRHQSTIDGLSDRWYDTIVQDHLIPLARKEILPIVRTHGEPTASKIGRELWDRASIWRFGWRLAYDRSPLPKQNLAQAEWERFVEAEAIPIFEQHMDEIVVSVQRIVSDVAANQAVRRELSQIATEIAADRETRGLVQKILQEAFVESGELREVWREIWNRDEARQALNLAGDRLEPVVRQIGDDLFGSQETGIEPNFARVLRSQILRKDRRWIVARRAAVDGNRQIPTIQIATDAMPYPIVHTAGAE